MVFIRPGTFRIGSPASEPDRDDGDEGPQTEVIISRSFWMGRHEVTQGEYLDVMGINPSHFNGVRWGSIDYGTDLKRPVEQVSWDDAVAYCAALTDRELEAGLIPVGTAYRLPTEAEWEYACRALTSTRFSYGDDPEYHQLTDYAWFSENSEGRTHPVGKKLPNPWGLYDMHGNVWEWCQDFWVYPGGLVADPIGRQLGVMVRGGGWGFRYEGANNCRSAARQPGRGLETIGFRVVLVPVQP
jgi:formylglycine-generating enzyme required for sulfatase activity